MTGPSPADHETIAHLDARERHVHAAAAALRRNDRATWRRETDAVALIDRTIKRTAQERRP